MGEAGATRVSVVIATRNRGDRVVATIRSILANDLPDFELRIVDQSEGSESRTAVSEAVADARLKYERHAGVGLAVARNAGIAASAGEIIAITDDDCEVPVDWLRQLLAAFSIHERIGVVFGNVVAAPYDRAAGFTPGYLREVPFLARTLADKHEVEGMGACMGVRRAAWVALGGFDEMLGKGAALLSNSEGDFAIRLLRGGWLAYETPRLWVTHHGFRSWADGFPLIRGYWYGSGAMYAKLMKLAPLQAARLLATLARRWAVGTSRVAASLGPRSFKLLRLMVFLEGFVTGLRTPTAAGLYVSRRRPARATSGVAVSPTRGRGRPRDQKPDEVEPSRST